MPGLTASMLAQLRAVEEDCMESNGALILTPTYGTGTFSDDAVTGYTGVQCNAQFWEQTRIPKVEVGGSAGSSPFEVSEWKCTLPVSVIPSTKAIIVKGGGTWQGAYSATTPYAAGNVVEYGDKFWRAIDSSTGQTPADGSSHWSRAMVYEILSTNADATDRTATICSLKLIKAA